MSNRVRLLLVVLALALVSPASIRAWQLDDAALKRVLIPPASHVIQPETSADFDADGTPETLALREGRAAIRTGNQTRWQSPAAWQVKQVQITDLNHDGIPEAVLLVWRPFKPWPVDTWLPNGGRIRNFHDARGLSCHIILISWKQNSFRELWAGSAMAEPVNSFTVAALRGNGRQYLVTMGGTYDDPVSAASRYLKVWEWNGFGFTVVNQLADSLHLMVPVQTDDGRVLILTD